MKYEHITFRNFLQDKKISPYFLHHSIKEKIKNFEDQLTLFHANTAREESNKDDFNALIKADEEILQAIRTYFIHKVKARATDDKEILITLKKLRWTKGISLSELRAMGLEASLDWNTTILGRLKLVRIREHQHLYYLLPIAESLEPKSRIPEHLLRRSKRIVQPA